MELFGSRLRALRLERRLSQGELGGGRYSGSYISHLEKGRRLPTAEVVDYLASRLQVEPTALLGDSEAEGRKGPRTLSVAIPELNARSALEEGDLELAVVYADQARRAAVKAGRPASWWTTTHIKAQAQLRLELHDDCIATVEELLGHHFTVGVPDLIAEAAVLGSRVNRAAGRLEAALAYAEQALVAAREITQPTAPSVPMRCWHVSPHWASSAASTTRSIP
ncbi:MAG: helix-turn-helix transcriptional regulator [Nocardioides sp.]